MLTRDANNDLQERVELPFAQAAVTSTTAWKFAKPKRAFVIEWVRYINPTGLAEHADNWFTLALKIGTTVAANIANTDADSVSTHAAIPADTFVDGVLVDGAINGAADDVISLVATEGGTASLPAGHVVVGIKYIQSMVFRVDLGTLRPAQRMPDGRVRVEAHITRAGVFQYLNHDGTVRRELRDPREVFDASSMRSFEQLPVTNTHPYEPVSSRNARQFMVGANDSSVARDDDHMKTMIMVADDQTIQEMDSGDKVQVSCGYTCDFDPTPGVHPIYGAYDGKQKNIRGNHIALVTNARAGKTARVRMDEAMRKDYAVMTTSSPVLTSIVEGHQHSVDISSQWSDGKTGETSWATADGYDNGHSHTWIRNSDGSVTLSMNEGHTHTVEGLTVSIDTPTATTTNDSATTHRNRSNSRAKENRMPDDKTALTKATELLANEKQRADSADSLVAQLKKQLLEVEARADAAEGALTVAREKLVEAERYKLDSVKFDEQNAAIVKLTNELAVMTKERDDASDPERLAKAVEVRCDIFDRAGPVLGPKVDMRHMTDQAIMVMTIDKLGKPVTDEDKKKPEHIRARFLERTDNYAACEGAMAAVRIAAAPPAGQRADTAADARARMEERNRNQWKPKTA